MFATKSSHDPYITTTAATTIKGSDPVESPREDAPANVEQPTPDVCQPFPPAANREPACDPQPVFEVDDTLPDPIPDIELGPEPAQPSNVSQEDSRSEAQMRSDRVQALFARYHVDLDETEWAQRPRVPRERVQKDVRIRVRYTCHKCSTTFGHDRVCGSCRHRRCARCSRHPARKDRSKAPLDAPDNTDATTLQAPRLMAEGGTCHECRTGFELDADECPNCHHRICGRCLHETLIAVGSSQGVPQGALSEKDPEHRTAAGEASTALS